MAYGVKILNNSGIVQIDQDYRNPLLVSSGTMPATPGSYHTISFPSQTTSPAMVFVRPQADSKFVGNYGIDSSSVNIACDGAYDYVVYGLDGPIADASPGFGLNIFNSSGVLVFGSGYEGARIRQLLALNMVWPDTFGAPPSQCSYPYTLSYTNWATRPWMCVNSLAWFDVDAAAIAASIQGANIVLNCGVFFGGSWTWSTNDGSSGDYTHSTPGGKFRMMLAERS